MPDELVALRAENTRLREAVERLRLLNEDNNGVLADLRARTRS